MPGTVAEMVRAASGFLPPAEVRVAQALLARGVDVIHCSVTEIAMAADTGVGTVVRACQSLGFKGFQAAKIGLAQDLLPLDERPQRDVTKGDRPEEVLAKLAESSGDALRRATASVEASSLKRAVDMIAKARRVPRLGVGTSAPLAQTPPTGWLLSASIRTRHLMSTSSMSVHDCSRRPMLAWLLVIPAPLRKPWARCGVPRNPALA